MAASNQWARRPDDERFLSLDAMETHFAKYRSECREIVVPTRRIAFQPEVDNLGMRCVVASKDAGPVGAHAPTHWSFGQLSQLAEAPAGYLRTMPSPIAADCLNYGLQFKRSIEDVGLLLHDNGEHTLRAATGPRYGRIWNLDLIRALRERFGNGVDGDWKIPGEFGKAVPITKANTTLYASDRDCFVFLADEKNRIEIPNRRKANLLGGSSTGLMARGFYLWNSEVGDKTMGLAMFLFDFVCCNRIIWGAEQVTELRIRHTASAPDKYLEDMQPVLEAYAQSSSASVTDAIAAAQAKKIADTQEDVTAFLAERFGKRMVEPLQQIHQVEEDRPIETLFDAVTAVTAYARGLQHQDARVELERSAGALIKLAA